MQLARGVSVPPIVHLHGEVEALRGTVLEVGRAARARPWPQTSFALATEVEPPAEGVSPSPRLRDRFAAGGVEITQPQSAGDAVRHVIRARDLHEGRDGGGSRTNVARQPPAAGTRMTGHVLTADDGEVDRGEAGCESESEAENKREVDDETLHGVPKCTHDSLAEHSKGTPHGTVVSSSHLDII